MQSCRSLSHSQSTGSSSVFPSNHTDQTTGGTTKSMSVHRAPPHPTQPAVPSAPSPCPVLPAAACFLQHHQRAPLSTRVWAPFSFSVAPSSVRAKAPALPGTLCLHPSRPPPPPCSPSLTWLQPPHLFLHTPSPKGLLWASAVAVAPAWNAVPWRLHGFSLPLLRDFSHNCPL